MQKLIDKYRAELEVITKRRSDCRSQYFDSGISDGKRDYLRVELAELGAKDVLISNFINELTVLSSESLCEKE